MQQLFVLYRSRLGAGRHRQKHGSSDSRGVNDLLRLDENGKPTGYCVDYLNELAQLNNWTYEYVNCTWADAVASWNAANWIILFPTNYMPEREDTMDFSTQAAGYTSSGLFARSDTSYGYENFSAYNGARIAVTPGSSNEKALDVLPRLTALPIPPFI